MNLLFRMIYATHCRSTHHKLVMDALPLLSGRYATRWQNLLIKNHREYLDGAKAPDKEFRDFRNHVLHVRENYWGGAIKKSNEWYEKSVKALRNRKWRQASFSLGVLSHYYTDPIMPFHTGQSDAESNIHRAFEWSVCKSYDELFDLFEEKMAPPRIEATYDPDWLEQLVRAGAEKANEHYETLIEHYDFKVGAKDPPAGLDITCQRILAELLGYAAHGWSCILQKAFREASEQPPNVPLTAEAFFTTLEIPVRWVTNKMEDAGERKLVQAMYDEFQRTGRVEKTLPEDDREIKELHAAEIASQFAQPKAEIGRTIDVAPEPRPIASTATKRETQESTAASEPAPQPEPTSIQEKPNVKHADHHVLPITAMPPRALPSDSETPESAAVEENAETTTPHSDPPSVAQPIEEPQPHAPAARAEGPKADEEEESEEQPQERSRAEESEEDNKPRKLRFYLDMDSDVVDAPSIGPKTARRLNRIGIHTVADLIASDSDDASDQLKVRYITPDLFTDWQDQATLVCRVPELRGHDAQILVACDYRDPDDIAAADAGEMLEFVEEFCDTTEGKRVIRSGKQPDLEEVTDWISFAQSSRRLRAA